MIKKIFSVILIINLISHSLYAGMGGGGISGGNLSTDPDPTLNADLKTNGQKIISESNQDIEIQPDGIGKIQLNGKTRVNSSYEFPDIDGNTGQILKTNGSGILTWEDDTGGIGSTTFQELTDTNITNTIQAQISIYNADDQKWENKSLSGDISIDKDGMSSIGADKVTEAMIDCLNAATNNYTLTFDSTSSKFEWQNIPDLINTGSNLSWDNNTLNANDTNTTYSADGEGLEESSEIFSLELDGNTLSKSISGLKVNSVSGITGANEDDITDDLIENLSNVSIASQIDKQVLMYESSSESWKNESVSNIITAGDNLTWDGNTLNADVPSSSWSENSNVIYPSNIANNIVIGSDYNKDATNSKGSLIFSYHPDNEISQSASDTMALYCYGEKVYPLDAGYELLLHLNGTQGQTTSIDSGQHSHAVTLAGGAYLDTSDPKFGSSCIRLDGNDDRIIIPDHSSWDFLQSTETNYTIDMWFKFASLADTDYVLFNQCEDNFNRFLIEHIDGSGWRWYSLDENGTQEIFLTEASETTDTNWHHNFQRCCS